MNSVGRHKGTEAQWKTGNGGRRLGNSNQAPDNFFHNMDDHEYYDTAARDEGVMWGDDALHGQGADEILMRQEEAADMGMDLEALAAFERRTVRKFLYIFWTKGPGPQGAELVKQVFAVTKAWAPDLMTPFGLDTFQAQAHCLGLTRAAMSASFKTRVVKLVEVSERRAGRSRPSFRAKFQKSATACERMAKAQRGNANRKNGKRSVKAMEEVNIQQSDQ